MIIEVFYWNNTCFQRWEGFQKEGEVTLLVTRRMIQNVIDKSNYKGWHIEHIGEQLLSNKTRVCAKMTIRLPLIHLHTVLGRLEIPWVDSDGLVSYYRSALDCSPSSFTPAGKYMLYKRGKGTKVVPNTPFIVYGTQSKGNGQCKGMLARRIN